MSNTKNTDNNNVSNNNIIITNDFTFSFMEFQLLNKAMGVIMVVNITKYIDKPSIPKYKSRELIS
jgi:hypothetical protein